MITLRTCQCDIVVLLNTEFKYFHFLYALRHALVMSFKFKSLQDEKTDQICITSGIILKKTKEDIEFFFYL